MRVLFIFIYLLGSSSGSFGQAIVFNPALKKQLDAVHKKDWQYRRFLFNMPVATRDSLAKSLRIKAEDVERHLLKLQAVNDSENMVVVEKIIRDNEFEYPGKSLVGEPTNVVALSVILHSGKHKKYYPRINQASVINELPTTAVVTLSDQMLVENRSMQQYGTHISAVPFRDSASGKILTRYYISPVQKPAEVNDRRKSVGFTMSIEEYAKYAGVTYDKTLTFAKLNEMYNAVK